jgi:hypothetical protein
MGHLQMSQDNRAPVFNLVIVMLIKARLLVATAFLMAS